MSTASILILVITLSSILLLTVQAVVPPSKTFKYVNQGEFGEYIVEYDANYRLLDIATFPFQLCFYNVTPNNYILGLRMGHPRSESIMRWVWDANRSKPVHENATLSFGQDGNLVLADVGGAVVWQTGTANKGVEGIKILPNGNIVLHDSQGKFIWQSFDHPTDTLFVGQTLKPNGPNKLVSRLSNTQPLDGPYSFLMEKTNWAMYYQMKNTKKPLAYYTSDEFGFTQGGLSYLEFYCEPETDQNFAFELGFKFNTTTGQSFGTSILSRPKYNSTYTILRVDIDGNLRMYTYYENVDYGAWEVTYLLFGKIEGRASECQLPKRCGSLGLCDDDQCVACPTHRGLLGWSTSCAPPALPSCKSTNVGKVEYFKVVGVEHFSSAYDQGIGAMKLRDCRNKCSGDCKCLGFFYKQESSKCLMVNELGTLVKVSKSSHVGYIKMGV